MVIFDNGCGMDGDGLRDFATYSLDQETRGNRASASNKSFISKFGVGAKQAGFFLGDSIQVFTKQLNSDKYLELFFYILYNTLLYILLSLSEKEETLHLIHLQDK